ncbi:MAG TPA: SusC/RagA family TonB-linked outer membrane protein, partial [Saprospiraceae bacterium]|nr:SusC/RagA family TonB-linked outer membrane protein [Saprospiraceae bacterium]
MLQEVVVVGYCVQKKSDLTGSVSKVKSEELTKQQIANLSQALQGKISGVQVTPISGKPGENAIIRIRGTGTLNDASPLFVVDGMFVNDISFLDPGDVESVEVLKDASATAIFGSRGANGVILITTKKSKKDQKAQIQISSSYGVQNLIKKIDLVNAHQYAVLANEVAENEKTGKPFDNPDIFGEGTDWQEQIFQQAPISNFKISAMGSTGKTNYNISVGNITQEGIVKGSKYQRTTFRLNNNYYIKGWLDFGHNLAFSYKKEEIAANVISSAYKADPTVEPVDSLGNFGNTSIRASVGNPVASIFYNDNKWWGYRTVGNIFTDVKPVKNLILKSSLGYDLEYNQGKAFVPVYFVSAIQQNKENQMYFNTNRTFSWLWENTATYSLNINLHRFTFLGGITAQETSFENFGGSRKNFPGESPELYYLNAGEIEGQTNYNSAWEWSIFSYLFRTNYVYNDKYLATISFRADGSSKFGINNRY